MKVRLSRSIIVEELGYLPEIVVLSFTLHRGVIKSYLNIAWWLGLDT
jgi:hypothetical protein